MPMHDLRRPKVLVTGATGFIGRHAVDALARRNFEVHALCHVHPGDSTAAMWHQADLLVPGAARAICREIRPSHLLHFAWYAAHGSFWESDANTLWLEASSELVSAFLESGGERIVGIGSCAEYARSDFPCSELHTPLTPVTLYGRAKNELRSRIANVVERYGAGYAWARIFHLFGPGEHSERLVPALIHAARTRTSVDCTDGDQLRDFLYAADVADACASITAAAVDGPINVGSGRYTRLRELVALVENATGVRGFARLGARSSRPGDPAVLVPAVARLHQEVRWTPPATLEERLREMAQLWQDPRAIEPCPAR